MGRSVAVDSSISNGLLVHFFTSGPAHLNACSFHAEANVWRPQKKLRFNLECKPNWVHL
jgi:hypothetical protein